MKVETESKEIKEYFSYIDNSLSKAYKVAEEARKKGYDPNKKVDITLAKNMAERVEGLISVVAPQLIGKGLPKRIFELENKYSKSDWRVAMKIGEEVAREKFCKFQDVREAMEVGIRIGLAYVTVGIVSAPLEGFVELKIKQRNDGKDYVSGFYSGPIRGAGGTAEAVSLLIIDYIRKKMGFHEYDPTEEEIRRYLTEYVDYHERVTNLQYFPSKKEVEFLMKHMPIEINGDPTEKIEVSNYKDLKRIETNRIRGGVCLVIAEGMAQKAIKIWKKLEKWGKEFDMENWFFLKEFLEIQKQVKAKEKVKITKEKITPNYTYIKDLVAGRPVLAFPLRPGGFRLRYGRTRASGYSASAIHPATMHLLNRYIAVGTQLKVERPGKATVTSSCDSIEGPIVKLKNGNVVQISSEKQAKEFVKDIEKILFLGDILFSYGDFSENNHSLVPVGYCEEWWASEFEKSIVSTFGTLDFEKFSDLTEIKKELAENLIKNPLSYLPDFNSLIKISKKINIPLHPSLTFHWNLINKKELLYLLSWINTGKVDILDNKINKIIIKNKEECKELLEKIGMPHSLINNEFVIIEKKEANILFEMFNLEKIEDTIDKIKNIQDLSVIETINQISKIKIRDKSGTFIGSRMGRPEKAKMRKLTGSPHVLFPVGDEGGRMRSFNAALELGKITGDFPTYYCSSCKKHTIFPICDICNKEIDRIFYCKECGELKTPDCSKHGEAKKFTTKTIKISEIFENAKKKMGIKVFPDLIKGVRGTSNKDHTPENIIKGILRAEYDIYVNKDGTTRYDLTEMPITHFKPKEIGTDIEKLKKLGYIYDIHGRSLETKDQILEIKPQDVILSSLKESTDETCDKVLFKVSKFVDKLLLKLYNLKSFYNLSSSQDLVGHLIIGIAPHTSAGIVGRIIGFSKTQGFLAHPMFHAAMRRDCDGDESCVILLMDALLNFSRNYLPDRRGSRTMDSPLVLTSRLIPSEVDDMVHGMDISWKYPLELYEAARVYKLPWDVRVDQLGQRLDTSLQYEKMGYTHETSSINSGVLCSAYKLLPSMKEKLEGQMEIAEKVSAVNQSEVAAFVINKHFIKDTRGNLRKFSTQQFRCVKCNAKYRRPPLNGKCDCGGKLIFTVSEGFVTKYLQASIDLAKKYDVPKYLIQNLDILQRRVEGVFGKEKEIQEGLGKWGA